MATDTNLLNNNSYVSFDATSLNDLIINRLNQNGIFTDQNYQGSNLSSLLDVISYTFSTLLYYLNKTSSETMFSEAQIYENMNRIVKILNYSPKGKSTQSVGYDIQSVGLNENNYMIPRYSYIKIGSLDFSFAKDLYFSYLDSSKIEIQNPKTDLFLFEGRFNEYPLYTALGSINEILFINLGQELFIDHNNIDVYVKKANTSTWKQWKRSENLFLNKSTDEVFEVRYNPNKNYEIKFGDDINGKQLSTGDSVLVYYLKINANATTIAANTLKTSKIVSYNSLNFIDILNDTLEYPSIVLNSNSLNSIVLNNSFPSNPYSQEESVEDIRKNAPKTFSYQQRLVTANDFQSYINNNYSNVFSDCYVSNNDDYLKGHMKYLYDIGIKSPQLDNSILYNQIKFSNSCNFNNVYVYTVPLNGLQQYSTAAQKELFINDLQDQKIMTAEIVPMDPIYMLFDFYVQSANSNPTINDLNENCLTVYKKTNSRQSDVGIINNIIEIIKNYFSTKNVNLAQIVDINKIASDIVNLEGVEKIQTYRKDIDTYVDGLSLLCWNKTYPELDVSVKNYNFKLDYFQYPAFNNIDNLINKIKIVNSTGIISVTDY
jgi:hypothetical protein